MKDFFLKKSGETTSQFINSYATISRINKDEVNGPLEYPKELSPTVTRIIGGVFSSCHHEKKEKIEELIALCHTEHAAEAFAWISDYLLKPPPNRGEEEYHWLFDTPEGSFRANHVNEYERIVTEKPELAKFATHRGVTHRVVIGAIIHELKKWEPQSDAFELLWEIILTNQNELVNREAFNTALTYIACFPPEARTKTPNEMIPKYQEIIGNYEDDRFTKFERSDVKAGCEVNIAMLTEEDCSVVG